MCQSLEETSLSWQSVVEPKPVAEQLLVEVKAASINFPDALLMKGRYQIRLQPPFIPGMEVSGKVVGVGTTTSGFAVGDRVAAVLPEFGGFAERIVLSPRFTYKIPVDLPFDVAACIPSAYATAYYALVNRAQLVYGETVLVLGAAGGVGMASISLAKALGAVVIAAVGNEEKAALVARFSADHVINYSKDDLSQAVKAFTNGGGADIVVDPVGGDRTEQALRAIAWGGRHLVIGFAAGAIPAVATNLLLLKSASLVGVNFGGYTSRFTDPAKKICQHVITMMAEDASLWPTISRRIPMAEGGESISGLLARAGVGKIVLTLDD